MPGSVRFEDICTGHPCWSPRPNDQGSNNVLVNSRGMHRVGDHWIIHCCDDECHDGLAQNGSPNVICNGVPACRIGDPVDCGSDMKTGSSNVILNERYRG